MREQELRIADEALEPFLLQVTRREVAQQHRNLPVLHQLVGKAGIAARDLLRDDGKGLHLGRRVELHSAELLGDAERADADLVGAGENFRRQPLLGDHGPFALPVLANERDDDVVHERATAVAHENLFLGKHASTRWPVYEEKELIARRARRSKRHVGSRLFPARLQHDRNAKGSSNFLIRRRAGSAISFAAAACCEGWEPWRLGSSAPAEWARRWPQTCSRQGIACAHGTSLPRRCTSCARPEPRSPPMRAMSSAATR